jgi:hypothetical protein
MDSGPRIDEPPGASSTPSAGSTRVEYAERGLNLAVFESEAV